MRRQIITTLIAAFLLATVPSTVQAGGIEDGSLPLCPPDLYYDSSQDCLPLGPTAYLLDMAEIGITFPETPLPIRNPDPSLSEVQYKYAYVVRAG